MQRKLHMDFHPGTNPEVFETRILEKSEGFLYLEETYCYPRGGGQPGDRGLMINSDGQSSNFHEVLPGEMIKHPVADLDIFSVGEKITCEIDTKIRN
ncbi:MAG: alanine--tRNA ligase-related protein, partial [Candidatus Thermoplasmatota archaeon]|nr:alanine--tRNA ligase-related protein [Candidatus Thermoplasmatota archaeon]MEC9075755.1 alanine--tRNA ligase-related protein [Candidatus Thermoplasmatota archaeon]